MGNSGKWSWKALTEDSAAHLGWQSSWACCPHPTVWGSPSRKAARAGANCPPRPVRPTLSLPVSGKPNLGKWRISKSYGECVVGENFKICYED